MIPHVQITTKLSCGFMLPKDNEGSCQNSTRLKQEKNIFLIFTKTGLKGTVVNWICYFLNHICSLFNVYNFTQRTVHKLSRKSVQSLEYRAQSLKFRVQSLEFKDQSLEFRVQRLEFRDQSLEIRVQSFEFRVWSLVFRVQRLEFRVQCLEFRVQSLEFSVQSLEFRDQSLQFTVQSLEFRVQMLD